MKAERILRQWPLHGLLLLLFVGLNLWRGNVARLTLTDIAPAFAVLIALGLGLLLVLRPLMRDWQRAGWGLTSLVAIGLFSGPLLARWPSPAALAMGFTAAILLMGGALAAIRRSTRDWSASTKAANSVLLIVVAITGGQLAWHQVKATDITPASVIYPTPALKPAANAPDVWHIILDRYASAAILDRVYAFDNQPFLAALEQRGFKISPDAYSNYQRTAHSLTSTLNYDYLDPVAHHGRARGSDWRTLYAALGDNRVMRGFSRAGYQTHYMGSWWNPTRKSPRADINHSYRSLPEFGRALIETSLIGVGLKLFALPFGDSRHDQCLRVRDQFDTLTTLGAQGGRKYVFAHLLVPHPPFVINADGSCRNADTARKASRRDNYIGQLRYANARLLELVDAIQKGPRPAIIILQADEGPWPKPHVGNELQIGQDPVAVDWARLSDDALREKMGILYAIHSPKGLTIAPQESPVNLYRQIFNASFGTQMPLLPERFYVFNNDAALYDFTPVGNRLKPGR